ncbi:hypothetical protein GW750_07505 [bacterium]|nr:hypothetical protein [bacterium]
MVQDGDVIVFKFNV